MGFWEYTHRVLVGTQRSCTFVCLVGLELGQHRGFHTQQSFGLFCISINLVWISGEIVVGYNRESLAMTTIYRSIKHIYKK